MPVEAVHQLFNLIVVCHSLFLQLGNVIVQCDFDSGSLLCVDRWGGAFDSLCFCAALSAAFCSDLLLAFDSSLLLASCGISLEELALEEWIDSLASIA